MGTRLSSSSRMTFPRRARGVTLIEVVIAVAVLGLILASVAPVLLLITHAQFEWREQRVAEALTRNQVEYIKVAQYDPADQPRYLSILELEPDLADGTYEIDVQASYPIGGDGNLQEITITIQHADEQVLQTKTYKVDRTDLPS